VLELDGITKRFGDVVALDDVSFTVEPGRMIGFLGPNGAGKTTAMRIVLGVLQADRGEVRWRGRPVDAQARRRFGYMPEERGLYPKMRVRDHLVYLGRLHGLSKEDAQASAERSIEDLGLTERAGDRVEALSLGNQQRVQLAAAMVHRPEVYVLDEPFSGLDPVGVDSLTRVLRRELDGGAPVVFSSHQLDLVERLCDGVVMIDHGRVVASGALEELRAQDRRRLLRVELEEDVEGWWHGVPGVRMEERLPTGAVLALTDGSSPGDVLDAARQAGTIRHFSRVRPTLSQLFRAAVAR
jgi:ABC-2 type transport system ATP-binding protein